MRKAPLVLLGALAACGSAPPPVEPPPPSPGPPPLCGGAPAGEEPEGATRPRQAIQGSHANHVTAMRFSPSGRYLATAADDQTVRVWDAEQRAILRTFRIPNARFRYLNIGVEWDGEGRLVYTRSYGPPGVIDVEAGVLTERPEWDMAPMLPTEGGGWVGFAHEDVPGFDKRVLSLITLDARKKRVARHLPPALRRLDRLVASRDGGTLAGSRSFVREPGDTAIVVWRRGTEQVVETGGRSVGPIALTPSGSELLAGVETSKGQSSVRVYSLGGERPRVRCELELPEGELHDLALSRDGKLAAGAVSGLEGSHVLLWDALACAERWRLDEAPRMAAERVAFSPGGERLVVGSGNGRVRALDVRGGRERGAFGSPLRAAYDVAFLGEDALAVEGVGGVRTWSLGEARALPRVRLGSGFSGSRVIAAGPRGELVSATATKQACEGGRVLRVDALRAGNTKGTAWAAAWPPRAGQHFELCAPSLSLDALALEAGAILGHDRRGELSVVRLPSGDTQPLDLPQDIEEPIGGDRCSQKVLSVDGAYAAAICLGPRGAVVWNARTGRVERTLAIRGRDTEPGADTAGHVAFSSDGKAVAVGYRDAVEIFALPGFERVHRVELEAQLSALALHAARGLLVVGTPDGSLEAFKDGTRLWASPKDGGFVSQVALNPSGSRVTSVSVDGTARLWDPEKGTLRATLADFEDEEWLITTPGGAFTGTPEVGDRVGWVFDAPLEHFGFERFAELRMPDLVRRRLAGEAVDLPGRPRRPPRVSLEATPSGKSAKLRATVSGRARVDLVRAFVEGRPLASKPVCAKSGVVELEVPLGPGVNRVGVAAFDARGLSSNLASADLVGPASASKPDAWVVAVGVSAYPRLPRAMQLEVADDDARGIAEAFRGMEGGAYGKVRATTLTDAEATPAAIRAALRGLSAMRPEDVAIVFFAGHGFKPSAGADMLFVTGGATLRKDGRGVSDETVREHSVSWVDIAAGLAKARGRALVLLDACHAGHVTQELVVPNDALADALVRQGRAGALVFAAAKGRQESLEAGSSRALELDDGARRLVSSDLEPSHGFFTGAFLRALGDAGSDRNGDGALQLSELVDDVTRRVTDASRGAQTPWVARRDLFGDFKLADAPRR